MRVIVKFSATVRPALLRWKATLGANARQRSERYAVYLEAMLDAFRQSDGIPPAAIADNSKTPVVWIWKYTNDFYVQFVVRDSTLPPRGWWDVIRHVRRLIRPPIREVTVVALNQSPPLRPED